jgi:hypothetical protein
MKNLMRAGRFYFFEGWSLQIGHYNDNERHTVVLNRAWVCLLTAAVPQVITGLRKCSLVDFESKILGIKYFF